MEMMKKLLPLIAALGLVCGAGVTYANPQHDRMAACNHDAGDKKGDERKAFMKDCLSAHKKVSRQDKMKSCNRDASGKKGDERKAFMKECLSN
jgi:hypothetical protein